MIRSFFMSKNITTKLSFFSSKVLVSETENVHFFSKKSAHFLKVPEGGEILYLRSMEVDIFIEYIKLDYERNSSNSRINGG